MTQFMTLRRSTIAAITVICFAPTFSFGAEYPVKPIRLVVPFSPGGAADIVARLVSDKMSRELRVPIIVDNRAGGAGGSIGTLEIMRAPADGYMIGIATVGTLGTAPAVAKQALYDPAKNFSYIVNLGQTPMVLAAGPAIKSSDFAGLLEEIKRQKPGTISFATGGAGGVAHLMGSRFQIATGTKLTHIPYRGASPATNDVVGGQVDLLFDALTSSASFLSSGRLRAFAVSGNHRISSLPGVPTFNELGLVDVSTNAWYGLIGPAGFSPEVIEKLSSAARRALADPVVQDRLKKLDTEIVGSDSLQFRQQVIKEFTRWRQLATSQEIVVD